MVRFILRRTIESLVAFMLATIVVFAGARLLPGDPAIALSGEGRDPVANLQIRAKYGLDDPIYVQYARWIGLAFRGDLGNSIRNGESVASTIVQRLPITLELALLSTIWAALVGLGSGTLAAVRRHGIIDSVVGFAVLLGLSVPTFWLGLLLVLVVAVDWQWLPASGFTPFFDDPLRNLVGLAMPCFVLGFGIAAVVARQTRSAMIAALASDYIRTARAKGLSDWRVIVIHGLRNSVLTVVTIIGLELGALISGAVVTEQIFLIPGFGRLIVDTIATRDYPMIEGAALVSAGGYIAINLLVDILYSRLNPRIRLQESRQNAG
jgi:peptide/nickel transport system permease protein